MARFLVIAHQTADSPELVDAIRQAKAREPDSTFVLLIPATPIQHVAGWTEGEARAVAAAAGQRAEDALKRHGIDLKAIRVGDADPVEAAADEWNERPEYDQVILSTLPHGTSRWLKAAAQDRLVKRLDLPVTHVVAQVR